MITSSSPSSDGADSLPSQAQLPPPRTANATLSIPSSSILPPSTTTTIASLPPEILIRIFELGAKLVELPGARDEERVDQCRRRCDFLCSSMLVCRSWRDLARLVLWEDIKLWKTGSSKVLQSSGWGLVPLRSLEILSPRVGRNVSTSDRFGLARVMLALSTLEGDGWALLHLKDTSLFLCTDKEDASYFRTCKLLRMAFGEIVLDIPPEAPGRVQIFPYLESLTLQRATLDLDFFKSISHHALTRLRISDLNIEDGIEDDGKLIQFLAKVAPQLTLLQVPHDTISNAHVLPILLSATNLRDLAFELKPECLLPFLKSYPSQKLSHFVCSIYPAFIEIPRYIALLESLRDSPCLSNLSSLHLIGPDDLLALGEQWTTEEGWWKERRIELGFLIWGAYPPTWDDE